MSSALLDLENPKPWADLRVNNLTVDGEINGVDLNDNESQQLGELVDPGVLYWDATDYYTKPPEKFAAYFLNRSFAANPSLAFSTMDNFDFLYDSNSGQFNLITGEYTVPEDGIYRTDFRVINTASVGSETDLRLLVNVVGMVNPDTWKFTQASSFANIGLSFSGYREARHVAGDIITFNLRTSDAGPSTVSCFVGVERMVSEA